MSDKKKINFVEQYFFNKIIIQKPWGYRKRNRYHKITYVDCFTTYCKMQVKYIGYDSEEVNMLVKTPVSYPKKKIEAMCQNYFNLNVQFLR